MQRTTAIIYQTNPPESYATLKLFCDTKGLKYNTYSKIKLPFKFKDFEVHRVKHNTGKFIKAEIK